MRLLKLVVLVVLVLASASMPVAARPPAAAGPAFTSIGPLAFGPGGVLFAADRQAATIFALNLGAQASGKAPGTRDITGVDQQIASVLGTTAADIAITDLAVHPTSKNTFVSVMRGQGAAAKPALVRIDGAGTIELVTLDALAFTSVTLPNPANADPNPNARRGRAQSVTDLAFVDGRLVVAGLSNEEFASKLWSVPYPFATTDRGASVEIYHGNHGALETRAPVMAFVPYAIGGQLNIVAGYTCTPLVKFPFSSLKSGEKVVGTTIAEFGAGNQPLDMILYKKSGQDFILMSNSRHGVLKIATAPFGSAEAITARVGGTAGVPFERVAALTGVEQLDLLDAERTIVIARGADGSRNLSAVILP
jgi:hypothetical protein